MNARTWIAFALFSSAFASSGALAQGLENESSGYFAGKLALGLGGSAQVDVEGMDAGDDDMKATYGLGFSYMYAPLNQLALGTQLALHSWTTEGLEELGADRSVLMDISLVLQGKHALGGVVELYVAAPLGITVDFFSETQFAGGEVTGGLGFNVGMFLGARFALGKRWGLLGEVGYSHHMFSHTLEYTLLDGTERVDLDVGFGQLGINIGAYQALK